MMFQNQKSRIVRNQLIENQQEDYIRSHQVKSKITLKNSDKIPFEDQTNKLCSIQSHIKPQNLQLIGYQPQNSYEDKNNQNISKLPKLKSKINLNQRNYLQPNNLQASKIKQTIQKQQNREEPQQNKGQCKQRAKLSCTNRKKIFNLDLQDSSDQQTSQNMQQKLSSISYSGPDIKQEENNKLSKQVTVQNRQQNIIFDSQPYQSKKKQFMRFDVQLSDDSSAQPQQFLEPNSQKIQCIEQIDRNDESAQKKNQNKKEYKNKKIVLDQFSSQSQQQQKNEMNGRILLDENDKGDQNNEQIQSLSVVRNLNIKKLKQHFEYIKIDENFISFSPIPLESKTSLIVKRNLQKSQYLIYDGQLICQIMKIQKCIGGTYKFFIVDKQVKEKKSTKHQYKQIAKMKSNFIGTQFHCYSNKQNTNQKYQSVSIIYQVNIFGFNGPRKIKMYTTANPIPSETNLQQLYQKNNIKNQLGIKLCLNKTPKWMPQLNAYVLNLRGTASHSSIKNCIIVDSSNQTKQYIIFGKKAKDIFNLQIKHPMTILQGVAFAISSFERKLACQ